MVYNKRSQGGTKIVHNLWHHLWWYINDNKANIILNKIVNNDPQWLWLPVQVHLDRRHQYHFCLLQMSVSPACSCVSLRTDSVVNISLPSEFSSAPNCLPSMANLLNFRSGILLAKSHSSPSPELTTKDLLLPSWSSTSPAKNHLLISTIGYTKSKIIPIRKLISF